MAISFSEEEMKILILFALKSAGGISEVEELCNVIASADANYMDIKTVLAKVIDSGLISTYDHNNETLLIFNSDADIVVTELKHKIPITVREKVAHYASLALAKMTQSFFVKASVSEPEKNGFCTVTVELLDDDGRHLIKMDVLAPTAMQGEMMAKKFKEDPSTIYQKIISALA